MPNPCANEIINANENATVLNCTFITALVRQIRDFPDPTGLTCVDYRPQGGPVLQRAILRWPVSRNSQFRTQILSVPPHVYSPLRNP